MKRHIARDLRLAMFDEHSASISSFKEAAMRELRNNEKAPPFRSNASTSHSLVKAFYNITHVVPEDDVVTSLLSSSHIDYV